MIDRFGACWVTQAESGRLVVPATWTRLVESSMKNKTYKVFSAMVSTVKKSHASAPLPWARRNSVQVGPVRRGAGPRPARRRDPSDRARSDPDPELAELSLDPHAPPSRILPPKTEDEIAHLRTQRRPARASPPVGPLAPHELAVPSKQRLRRDQERGPPIPGEGSARRREERSIAVLHLRASDRPAEDLHLVAEDGVLELELGHAPPPVSTPIPRTSTK